MAYYHCILFDVDGTLLDFEASESKALVETLTHYNWPTDAETQETYRRINRDLWAALEQGKIKKDRLVIQRFEKFMQAIQVSGNAAEVNRFYLDRLGDHADLMPGAAEALRELSEVATLAVVSNGVARVQYNRLEQSGLDKYMDGVFVSEKLGVEKPSRKFFETALRTLGVEQREKTLVVGDSLAADIQGGINAGLDTCWFNPAGQENPGSIRPTHTITTLEELYPLVMEEDELQNVGSRNRRHQI